MKPRWMSSTGRLVTVAVSRLVGCSSFLRQGEVALEQDKTPVKVFTEDGSVHSVGLDISDAGLGDLWAIFERSFADPEYRPTVNFILPGPDGEVRIMAHKIAGGRHGRSTIK